MKTSNKLVALIIILFSFLLFFLPNCSKQEKEVQIASICDLTGALGLYGDWVYKGVQIAINEINDKNGINGAKVKLIVEDSQSDPKSAVSAISKLVNIDKIKFIISGNGSGSVMAMAPIVNEKRAILFVSLASSPSITNAGDYIFRNRISGKYEIKEMARLSFQTLHFKNVALAVYDNEAGKAYIEVFKTSFEELGGKVVESVLLSPENTDFRTSILKIKSKNPDAVFTVIPVNQAAKLIKQSKELGMTVQWLGVSSLNSDQLFKIAGSAADGIIIASEGIDRNNNKYQVFEQKYFKKFNENPSIYSVNGYDATLLLCNLINKYGYNVEKVKKALYNLEGFSGAGGELKFDDHGDAIRNIVLLKAKNGKFERID